MHSYRASLQNPLSSSAAPCAPLRPLSHPWPDPRCWDAEEGWGTGSWREGAELGREQNLCKKRIHRAFPRLTTKFALRLSVLIFECLTVELV